MRRKVTAEGEPPDLPSLASVERVDETHLDSGDQMMGRPPKTPPPGYPARDRRAHPPLRRVNDLPGGADRRTERGSRRSSDRHRQNSEGERLPSSTLLGLRERYPSRPKGGR